MTSVLSNDSAPQTNRLQFCQLGSDRSVAPLEEEEGEEEGHLEAEVQEEEAEEEVERVRREE